MGDLRYWLVMCFTLMPIEWCMLMHVYILGHEGGGMDMYISDTKRFKII